MCLGVFWMCFAGVLDGLGFHLNVFWIALVCFGLLLVCLGCVLGGPQNRVTVVYKPLRAVLCRHAKENLPAVSKKLKGSCGRKALNGSKTHVENWSPRIRNSRVPGAKGIGMAAKHIEHWFRRIRDSRVLRGERHWMAAKHIRNWHL